MCGDIAMLKHDTGVTIKNFKKQSKINGGFALLFVLVGAYAYLNEVRYEKLREEVEGLKKSKGE
jgi:hypothetical protein